MTAHEIVEGLVRHAPDLIRRGYRRSGWDHQPDVHTAMECVRLSRLAHDVLRRLGVASEPIDTIVSAWNHHFAIWQQSGVDHPSAYRHTNDPLVLAALGFVDKYKDTDTIVLIAHTVIYVPATAQIIDLDCWQLARPSRGIQLPTAIALPWDGRQAQYETPAGAVQYRPWPAVELERAGAIPAPSMESRGNWTFGAFECGPLSKVIARRIRERAGHRRRAGL